MSLIPAVWLHTWCCWLDEACRQPQEAPPLYTVALWSAWVTAWLGSHVWFCIYVFRTFLKAFLGPMWKYVSPLWTPYKADSFTVLLIKNGRESDFRVKLDRFKEQRRKRTATSTPHSSLLQPTSTLLCPLLSTLTSPFISSQTSRNHVLLQQLNGDPPFEPRPDSIGGLGATTQISCNRCQKSPW